MAENSPYSYQSSEYTPSSANAQGGKASNGLIFNSSSSGIGLVKMLAISGVVLLALRILKG